MNRELPVIRIGEDYPLFDRISIETHSQCTRKCSFCPLQFRDRKLKFMSDDLYESILNQLAELKFSGVIQFFYLNEPLMDKERFYKLSLLRLACPDSTIHLTTNGDTLKDYYSFATEVDKLFEVGVNSLNFNIYDDSKKVYFEWVARYYINDKKISTGVHNWKHIFPEKFLSVSDMRNPEHLHNWSGTFDYGSATDLKCSRPARHLVIQYDGQIPLCCAQDPTRKDFESLGDANTQSLREIWNSEKFFRYRWNLQNKIRIGQCTGCNELVKGSDDVRQVSLEKIK